METLAQLNLQYQWVKAIDGELLDAQELGRVYRPKDTTASIYTQPLSRGEIGCYLSHLECYRLIIEQNMPYALIMEDDMCPNANLVRVLEQRHKFPKNWDIINLYPSLSSKRFDEPCFYKDNAYHRQKLFGQHYMSKYISQTYNTCLYLITQPHARRLISHLKHMCTPIDIALFDIVYSISFPHAVYKRHGNACITPDTGKIVDTSQIAPVDGVARNMRGEVRVAHTAVSRILRHQNIGKRIGHLLYIVVHLFPWRDDNKLHFIAHPHLRTRSSRYRILLRACDWKTLWSSTALYSCVYRELRDVVRQIGRSIKSRVKAQ